MTGRGRPGAPRVRGLVTGQHRSSDLTPDVGLGGPRRVQADVPGQGELARLRYGNGLIEGDAVKLEGVLAGGRNHAVEPLD